MPTPSVADRRPDSFKVDNRLPSLARRLGSASGPRPAFRAHVNHRRLVYREWDDNGTRRSRQHVIGRVQFGGRPNGDEPTNDDQAEEAA